MAILLRLLRTTFQNISRNILTSTVAVLATTLLFLIFNGILFVNFFQQSALESINEKLDLALNFTKPVDEFQVNSLESELKETFPEIRAVNFISSEVAFERFIQNFGASSSNSNLAQWLEKNLPTSPLPDTLVISADAKYHDQILSFLATHRLAHLLNLDTSATGKLGASATEKIITLDQSISRLTFISAVVFSLLATLIIIAVLRLAILSRSQEIGIMRLTGATREFIRLPFLFEGLLLGMLASIFGSRIFLSLIIRFDIEAFTSGVYGGFGELIQTAIGKYDQAFILLLGWQILGAIIIGVLASFIATRKYLKKDLVQ